MRVGQLNLSPVLQGDGLATARGRVGLLLPEHGILILKLVLFPNIRCLYCHTSVRDCYPEGRPVMSDVLLLSGISGLSFDFPFPISSVVVFLPSPLDLSVLSFFC